MGSNTKTTTQVNVEGQLVTLTNLEKIVWPSRKITKYDYLKFLTVVAPFMLPFIENRLLTVIRFPNGVHEESFYQKNCPDYAPAFVQTKQMEGHNYIVCSKLPTLFWLGNQSAIEFHVPFQPFDEKNPSEIVLDLDPPTQNEFSLAIEAALILKDIFDKLKLLSFIKTSGNKGLQIYLPLDGSYTYAETRKFTEFLAKYLETKYSKFFTTERLKKNRYNRLYVDFLQHAKGKTIIAPYSLRGNEDALMATPLDWQEVDDSLHPKQFTMEVGLERISKSINPFEHFFEAKKKQPLRSIIDNL